MKKFLKTIVWVVPVLLICFLLLPFVMSEREKENPQEMNMRFSEPQVYSGNPFTAFMDRLRNVFASNREQDRWQEGEEGPSSAKNISGKGKKKNKSRAAAMRSKNSHKLAAKSAKGRNNSARAKQGGENNSLDLPDSDEWVIGEQKMPLVAAKGLHETKLTDSPYERQKAAQSASGLIAAEDTIPTATFGKANSLWDTYVASPLKHLFGKGEKQRNAQDRTAPAFRKGRNAANAATPSEADSSDTPVFDRSNAIASINNLIGDIATMRADAAYPNPTTAKEREARERMIAQETRNEIVRLNKSFLEYQEQIFEENPTEHVDVVAALLSTPLQLYKGSDFEDMDQDSDTQTKENSKAPHWDNLKYVRAVPWETNLEKLTAKQDKTEEEKTKERFADGKMEREKLENSILFVYGVAEGENGKASFISDEDFALMDPNNDNTGNLEISDESKLKKFANQNSSDEHLFLADLLPNNRTADMAYTYRKSSDNAGGGTAPVAQGNGNNSPQTPLYWAAAALTKENGSAVGPLAVTVRFAGAEYTGIDLDESLKQQYVKKDFPRLMESRQMRQSVYNRGWERVKATVSPDTLSPKDYQALLKDLKEEYDTVMQNYYSDASAEKRNAEYQKQAQYNLDKNSMFPVTPQKLAETPAAKAVDRETFLKLGHSEEQDNQTRDMPTNLVTGYIVLNKTINNYPSSKELANDISKAWQEATGFALQNLTTVLYREKFRQQQQPSAHSAKKDAL